MKTMTTREATERLTAMIEPKPEEPATMGDARRAMNVHGQVWCFGPNANIGKWKTRISPLTSVDAAIRCVEAAGYRAAIGFVEHTQNTGEVCVAMRTNVHYRTYHEYTDGNHARALSMALLHALEGEPVEIVDEGEVAP
jgi:hypothetical protein